MDQPKKLKSSAEMKKSPWSLKVPLISLKSLIDIEKIKKRSKNFTFLVTILIFKLYYDLEKIRNISLKNVTETKKSKPKSLKNTTNQRGTKSSFITQHPAIFYRDPEFDFSPTF